MQNISLQKDVTMSQGKYVLVERALLTPARALLTPGRALLTPGRALITPGRALLTPGFPFLTPGECIKPASRALYTLRSLITPGNRALLTPGRALLTPGALLTPRALFAWGLSLVILSLSIVKEHLNVIIRVIIRNQNSIISKIEKSNEY